MVSQIVRVGRGETLLRRRDLLAFQGVIVAAVLKFLADAAADEQAVLVRVDRNVSTVVQTVQIASEQEPIAERVLAPGTVRPDVGRLQDR